MKRAIGEVINIGSTEEVTIEGLAKAVKQRTQSDSPITFVPYEQAYEAGFEDMQRRVPALDKLQGLTNFAPATRLPEIIDRVTADFKKRADRDNSGSIDRARIANAQQLSAGS